MMTLAQAQALLPASTLVGDGAIEVLRVHSDTRSLQPGDLFVALRGENFDAHDFLAQAKASGAAAALAERGLAEAGLPGLQVADTQAALTALAHAWRQRFHLPLIAVTGSNGKTTVTQMIASILRAWLGDAAFATAGNLNNHIGVPLTLLRLRQDDVAWHRAGVVELGMNHPGEIAALAALTAPTVALVNNAQREHQEFMASVEAVAHENGAVIAALGASGTAVFPADDEHAPIWHRLAGNRPTLTFALEGAADVTCHAEWVGDHWALLLQTPAGASTIQLQVAGWHNVKNALAATACALAAGCTLEAIRRGLEAFAPVKGRSQVKRFQRGSQSVTLIDDTYNANPDSVRAAIEVLASLPGPRWLVLGDMGEVGDNGPAFHTEVGAFAKARGIDALWTVGSASTHAAAAFPGARHFDDMASLLAALPQAPACAAVVVKGSRFMKTEQVVAALLAAGESHAA
ncbi:UDP-N-acetylmuramoyl-tripeptide--D-alanyl-D-alanine ligase [Rhizobacter sp. Root404]|uniref:UDP-N-acetylmuramoyl-tripeptide--D-alanyl-D- alanine ligase n=1 Tax=Rhizobacter sp. Root404 TaxID=1736528 RepID=UPI0006FBD592|nr:UDP-N-acetylmuramoyl-tripeptide--D-alanyl-D-alanine ligase [Rhizobacter sp. Root404]KQW38364.1 UDP-N-acetylmuramoylalanyl-D-glutamyl-2, 6-diaminopimelate--D-alanyl-D-alanine ligase [Rhizobacter sp. Root404]